MNKKSKVLKSMVTVFAVIMCVCLLCAPAFASSGSESVSGSRYKYLSFDTIYASEYDSYFVSDPIGLVAGETYYVCWNGDIYELVCEAYTTPNGVMSGLGLGNAVVAGGEDNGLPFGIAQFYEPFNGFNGVVKAISGDYDSEFTVAHYVPFFGDILTDSGSVVTSLTSWIGSVARMVINTPVLLIGFTIGLATLAFGIFKGLKR